MQKDAIDVARAIEIMDSIPASLETFLYTGEASLRRKRGDGWSAKEYIGHLCDAIEVWDQRIYSVVTEDRPFLPAYDERAYVSERNHQARDLWPVITACRARRARTVALLRALSEEDWERIGVHEERGPLDLRDLVMIIAEHEQGHLDDLFTLVSSS